MVKDVASDCEGIVEVIVTIRGDPLKVIYESSLKEFPLDPGKVSQRNPKVFHHFSVENIVEVKRRRLLIRLLVRTLRGQRLAYRIFPKIIKLGDGKMAEFLSVCTNVDRLLIQVLIQLTSCQS
jgi:hypothetical protein